MTGVRTGKPNGRPPVIDSTVLLKLEEAFSLGCTDIEACLYADVSSAAFYAYQDKHPEFKERKEELKERPVLKARTTVVKSLTQPEYAFRYLERKKKDEFSVRTELTGKEGKDLIPQPIMNVDVLRNNSDQKNIDAPKKD